MKMGYWKVFIKLMSKHWFSHLGVPLMVGIIVEISNGWAALRGRPISEVGAHLVSRQGVISHIGIGSLIITFLFVAVWRVHKDTKSGWTNESGEQLNEVLKGVTSFFATCTIPLEQWFHADTQKYFSDLIKHNLRGDKFPQHRVLLFRNDGDLEDAKQEFLDLFYSKNLVAIHKNYEIPLGYLRPREIGNILNDFKLEGVAASWEKLKAQYQREAPKEESKGPILTTNESRDAPDASKKESERTISTLDFAVIGFGKDQHKVYAFDKTGDYIKLDVIETTEGVRPYLNLRKEIWARVFDGRVLPDAHHDFAVHCGMDPLKIDEGSLLFNAVLTENYELFCGPKET
jgi:hypothetical protein